MKPGRRFLGAAAVALLAMASRVLGADPAQGTVILPPFVVTGTSLKWLWARAGRLEVLSRCSPLATRQLIERMARADQIPGLLMPPDLQTQVSTPVLCLFYGEDMTAAIPEAIRQTMKEAAARGVTTVPTFILADRDQAEIVALCNDVQSELVVGPGLLQFSVASRCPPLPAWFQAGFLDLNRSASHTERSVVFHRQTWISQRATRFILDHPGDATVLLPLGQLFADPETNGRSGDKAFMALWRAEASLLVRWAFDGGHPERRRQLWEFLRLVSASPSTASALFEKCFGYGYAEMMDRLGEDLRDALTEPRVVEFDHLPPLPRIELRTATDAEVGRIKGNWERLEFLYVKERYPLLAGTYGAQARQTLDAAYRRNPADSGVLATLGLLDCETGDDRQGRPLLEAATEAGVVHPTAYLELARLRFAEATAAPGGPKGALSAAQAEAVAEPLLEARRIEPPLAGAYLLLCTVWLRCPNPPPPADLAALREGPQIFPGNLELLYLTASVEAQCGMKTEAAILADNGLRLAPKGPERDRFVRLKADLVSAKPG